MAVAAGDHRLGPEYGQMLLRTSRDGLAAQAGHDLTIEVTRWSGRLAVADDGRQAELAVVIDLRSLVVLTGTGGIKPLTDRDRREILATAGKVLLTDRYPEARLEASSFEPDTSGTDEARWRGVVTGTLTLRDRSGPVRLDVTGGGGDRYRATATVVQSDYGIKPYTAFLGALRVRDAVDIEVELDLSGPQTPPPKRS